MCSRRCYRGCRVTFLYGRWAMLFEFLINAAHTHTPEQSSIVDYRRLTIRHKREVRVVTCTFNFAIGLNFPTGIFKTRAMAEVML